MSVIQKKIMILLTLLLTCFITRAQESLDEKYREDQFYVGLNFNVILNTSGTVEQNSFLYGIHLGFIRDMPINKQRNLSLGLGIGYATNSYYTNLKATNTTKGYEIIEGSYDINKIESHFIELPIEFRWRTSTPTSTRFWRVYTGLKLSYSVGNYSKYIDNNTSIIFENPNLSKIIYGGYVAFNFKSIWNLFIYYPFNNLFRDTIYLDGITPLSGLKSMQIGMVFYIL